MSIITLTNISKSFGPRDLFSDVSFLINENERVALIGANGSGKTTILKIITNELKPDGGSINIEPGATVGYLPQEVDLPPANKLLIAVLGITPELYELASKMDEVESKMAEATGAEADSLALEYSDLSHSFDGLNGFDIQINAKAILLGLGFDCNEIMLPVDNLSGGQKTRAALGRLLLQSPDLILLDEPTNHLDIHACEWLQDFLMTRFQGAALIVSHDRYFMDKVITDVFELENGSVKAYRGNYSTFAALKSSRLEEQQRLYKSQQKEIARIEEAIQTLFSHRKFTRRDSKVKQLERMEKISKVNAPSKSMTARIGSSVRSGKEVVRLSKLSKSYAEKKLFESVDYVFERSKKVGIVGPNGSGKSTLLKTIAEIVEQDDGEVLIGHNVKMAYFAQQFDHLDPKNTVLDELMADADIDAKAARDLLARFLFMGDDAFKKVRVLSGGETCRLALAKILAQSPNLLLLDEPTNHLDIVSREALEDALKAFDGTVITASHDRYLLDEITDEIIEIKDGKFTQYLGNYSTYREKSAEEAAISVAVVNTPTNQNQRPLSALRELEKNLRDEEKKHRKLEKDIHTIEERLEQITIELGDESNYKNGSARELTLEYDSLTVKLSNHYKNWENTCNRIAEIEQQLKQ